MVSAKWISRSVKKISLSAPLISSTFTEENIENSADIPFTATSSTSLHNYERSATQPMANFGSAKYDVSAKGDSFCFDKICKKIKFASRKFSLVRWDLQSCLHVQLSTQHCPCPLSRLLFALTRTPLCFLSVLDTICVIFYLFLPFSFQLNHNLRLRIPVTFICASSPLFSV